MVTVKSPCTHYKFQFNFIFFLVVAASIFPLSVVHGAEWRFTPRFSLAEIYTDNIRLAPPGEEESDYVTQLAPGLSIEGTGRRFELNLNHRTQYLVFARESSQSSVFHQMQGDATAELFEDLFLVDARSSISQHVISARERVAVGNLPITGNRSDVITFRVSPYLKNNFAGYADAELRYSFDMVHIETGASDSISHGVNFNINSGERFTRLRWNGSYERRQINRDNGDGFRFVDGRFISSSDVQFENADAFVSYQLTDEFSLLAQGGYTNNDFRSIRRIRNGFFWAGGLGWRPSRYFSVEALYGSRFKRATMTFSPHPRLSMELTWRERDVGLNPGTVFNGTLRYRRRFSQWEMRYFEDTQTIQQILELQPVFEQDPFTGDPITAPEGEPILSEEGSLESVLLTDEVIVRQRFQLEQFYSKGKTDLRFTLFSENREFQESLREIDRLGGNASWTWRFARRLRSDLRFFAQDITFSEDDRSDLLWFVQASLIRDFSRHLQGSVSFRHAERDSNQDVNNFKENRVIAQIAYTF